MMILPRKGLFLDFDGTLANSLGAMETVYEDFLKSYGKQPKPEEFQKLNGPPLEDVVAILKEVHSLPCSMDELHKQYLDLVKSAHSMSAPAIGALDLVVRAKEHGWIISIVTSSNHADVWIWLKLNGFSSYTTKVVGGDDVEFGKPHPEPYSVALSISKCQADISWAVEDTPIGATSARNAGLKTFVIAGNKQHLNWPAGVIYIDKLSSMLRYFTNAEG